MEAQRLQGQRKLKNQRIGSEVANIKNCDSRERPATFKSQLSKMNIQSQFDQHKKCVAILEMIDLNERFLSSHITDANDDRLTRFHGRGHFDKMIADRQYIYKRLIAYYAKQVAKLAAPAYDEALQTIKPGVSNG